MRALTRQQRNWLVALLLAALAVLLIAPQLRQQRLDALDQQPRGTAAPPVAALSASQRAVVAQQRQRAQTLLAEIAVAAETLQPSQPQRWAGEQYNSFNNWLSQGDSAFASSNFDRAVASYQAALTAVQQLLEQRPLRLAELLDEAAQLYRDFAASELAEVLQLAELLQPENSAESAASLERWQQQLSLLAATQQAVNTITAALENDQLSAAASAVVSARHSAAVDSQHPALLAVAEQLQRAQQQADYQAALQRGYADLSSGQLDSAERALQRAQQLQPSSEAAASGLNQVLNQRRQRDIDEQLRLAGDYEKREQWQQAVAVYQQLEQRAPGLLEAQVRLLSSRVRAEFDQQWQQLTAAPYALVAPQQRRSAQSWLQQAEQIAPRGERLHRQIAELRELLQQTAEKRTVLLRSDGITEVTVFKVAELGRFNQHPLQLLPGRYTALGSCAGHRDRQVNFEVTAATPSAALTVDITCGQPL